MAGSIVNRANFSDSMQNKGFWQAVVMENMMKEIEQERMK